MIYMIIFRIYIQKNLMKILLYRIIRFIYLIKMKKMENIIRKKIKKNRNKEILKKIIALPRKQKVKIKSKGVKIKIQKQILTVIKMKEKILKNNKKIF